MELETTTGKKPIAGKLIAFTLALALLSGAAELSSQSTEGAEAATTATRSLSGPKPASLGYVDKAILPIARQVIQAIRRAKPSTKDVTRNTSQMAGLSYKNVTNINVKIPAKTGRGYYSYAADFKGLVKPNSLVTVVVSSIKNDKNNAYSFLLGRTKKDGPTNTLPMHWLMGNIYAPKIRFYDSCSVTSGRVGPHPILSKQILAAGIGQARNVLRRATKRYSIARQKDILARMKPAKDC